MPEKEWKGVTEGGEIGQSALRLVLRLVDVRFCYVLIIFIIPFYFIFSWRNALSIYHYFRHRQHFGKIKSWAKTYLNHVYFGQLVLDRFAIFAGQGKKFRIKVTGQEIWDAVNNDDNRGCLVIGSHIGNFELAGYLLGKSNKKMNGLVYANEAKKMQQYRSQILSGNDMTLIPISDDFSHVFLINAALQRREIISMTGDRYISGHKAIKAEFLGAQASFPEGVFRIGAGQDVNIVTLFVMKSSWLNYEVYVKQLNISTDFITRQDKMESLLCSYVSEMEQMLKKYPEQWYNFYEFWER
jgi:predicted LPLAT superfamily acyltransferase